MELGIYIKARETEGLKTNEERAFDKSTLQTTYTKCYNSCVTLERKRNKKNAIICSLSGEV